MTQLRGFRRIVNARDAALTGQDEDPYLVKLLKFIPAEAISAYPIGMAAADKIVSQAQRDVAFTSWFLFLAITTPVWAFLLTSKPGQRPKWLQIIFAPIAFTLWFLNLGDVHVKAVLATLKLPQIDNGVAALVLIIVTIVATIIETLIKPSGVQRQIVHPTSRS